MSRDRDERARSQTACARPGESLKCGLRCSVFGNARPVGKNCLRNFSERAARNAGSAQGMRNSATRLSGSRPALLPPLGNNGPEKPSPGCKVSLHSRATLSPPDARGSLLHNQFTGSLCVCPFCFLRRRRLGSQHLCDIHARLAAGNAFNRMAHKSFSLKNVIKKVIFLATRSQRFCGAAAH